VPFSSAVHAADENGTIQISYLLQSLRRESGRITGAAEGRDGLTESSAAYAPCYSYTLHIIR